MDALTPFELDYLLHEARQNRDNSAALVEVPGQRWAAAHKQEVTLMETLIAKQEAMRTECITED